MTFDREWVTTPGLLNGKGYRFSARNDRACEALRKRGCDTANVNNFSEPRRGKTAPTFGYASEDGSHRLVA